MATFGAALRPVDPDHLNPEQERIQSAIVQGPRGRSGILMNLWLQSPELADRAQKLGAYLRFGTALPAPLREMAILTVARRWDCPFEWGVHVPFAQQAGVPQEHIDAIAADRPPEVPSALERNVLAFVREMLDRHRPSAETAARLRDVLDDKGIVELCALIGHYIHGALVLNAADIEAPETSPAPWRETRTPVGV